MLETENKALFLDRDGVINVNHGYVYKQNDFDWLEGIFSLIRQANDKNYKVIVVTNQSGIGRGYYQESEFDALNDWMVKTCKEQYAVIDKVYYCPHHPSQASPAYLEDCACRKPKPGMALLAQQNEHINLANSIMVGDKFSDMEFASNAGIGRAYWLNVHTKNNTQPCNETISHNLQTKLALITHLSEIVL